MPSPAVLINGLAAPQDVAAGSTVSITLASSAGVNQWAVVPTDTDETNLVATVLASAGVIGSGPSRTITFTAPATQGSAVRFSSQIGVNGLGLDANGIAQAAFTTTFKINVASAGNRVMTSNEQLEQSAIWGWAIVVNPLLRAGLASKSVGAFGAIPDGRQVTDGAITSGTANLACATSTPFTAADVGKGITVAGAGAAGVTLVTTILAFVDSGHVTLNTTAGTTVASGALVTWGTDNGAKFATAATALSGTGTALLISGAFFIGTTVTLPSNLTLTFTPGSAIYGGITGTYPLTGSIFRTGLSGAAVASTTVNASAAVGAKTIVVASAAGLVAGQILYLSDLHSAHAHRSNYKIENVSGTTITLERPLSTPYQTGDAANAYAASQVPTNIRIYGNGVTMQGPSTVEISFQTSRDCYIENVQFVKGNSSSANDAFGIFNNGCYRCTAYGLVADAYTGGAPSVSIGMESADQCDLIACRVNNAASYCFAFIESYDCQMIDCIGTGGTYGVVWQNDILTFPGADRNRCIGCRMIGCTSDGYFVGSGSKYARILGCSAQNCGGNGITLNGAVGLVEGTMIEEFLALGNTGSAISIVAGAKRTQITGLTADNNGAYVILAGDEFSASNVQAQAVTGSQVAILCQGGDSVVDNARITHQGGGAAAFVVEVTAGSLRLSDSEIYLAVNGDVAISPTGGSLYLSGGKVGLVGAPTGTFGLFTQGGTTTVLPNCDLSAAATPISISSGTVLVGQVGGIYALATTGGASTVAISAAQGLRETIVTSGVLASNATVNLPNIPGMAWTFTNNNTGAFTTTFQVTGGTGFAVAQTKTASGYVNGSTALVREGPDT